MKKNTKYALLALAAFWLFLIAGQIEYSGIQTEKQGVYHLSQDRVIGE